MMLDPALLPWLGPVLTVLLNAGALAVAYGRLQQRVSTLEMRVSDLDTNITNHLTTMNKKVVEVVQEAIADYGRQEALDRSHERIRELEEQVAELHKKHPDSSTREL
mgnify:CR=1 FL=1